jgi:Uma2 family endonuclease
MGEPAQRPYVTHAEYVAREEKSDTKHEWLDGVIYDMSGGTPDHAGLAAAIIGALSSQLRGKRCRVYSADLKVRVLATGLSTYADVSVLCGQLEVDPDDRNAAVNPVVLVEVLSDSTEAYDRGEKFGHYRRIPSLAEYVLVSQHAPKIEVFRRNEAGKWVLAEEAGAGEAAPLVSIGCVLSVDEVYADPLREPPGGEPGTP